MSQIRQLQIIGHFEHLNLSDFIKPVYKELAKLISFWMPKFNVSGIIFLNVDDYT